VEVSSDMFSGGELSCTPRNNFNGVHRVLNKGLNSNFLTRTNLCVTYRRELINQLSPVARVKSFDQTSQSKQDKDYNTVFKTDLTNSCS